MKMLRLTKKRITQIPCLVIASDDLRKAFLHDALEAIVEVKHGLDEGPPFHRPLAARRTHHEDEEFDMITLIFPIQKIAELGSCNSASLYCS